MATPGNFENKNKRYYNSCISGKRALLVKTWNKFDSKNHFVWFEVNFLSEWRFPLNVWMIKLMFLYRPLTGILVSTPPFCIQSCLEILITVSLLILLVACLPLPAPWTERNTILTFCWFVYQISMVITVMAWCLTILQWSRWLSRWVGPLF